MFLLRWRDGTGISLQLVFRFCPFASSVTLINQFASAARR
jgi:hypothetical protein